MDFRSDRETVGDFAYKLTLFLSGYYPMVKWTKFPPNLLEKN